MSPNLETQNYCKEDRFQTPQGFLASAQRLLQQDSIERLDEESDLLFGDEDNVTLMTLPLSSSGIYTLIKNSMMLEINSSRVPYK